MSEHVSAEENTVAFKLSIVEDNFAKFFSTIARQVEHYFTKCLVSDYPFTDTLEKRYQTKLDTISTNYILPSIEKVGDKEVLIQLCHENGLRISSSKLSLIPSTIIGVSHNLKVEEAFLGKGYSVLHHGFLTAFAARIGIFTLMAFVHKNNEIQNKRLPKLGWRLVGETNEKPDIYLGSTNIWSLNVNGF